MYASHARALAASPPPYPGALSRDYFAGHIPENEQYRPTWGRTLDLDRIDRVIKLANSGIMSQITDLSRETISLDAHLSSLLQKRLNRVSSLEWYIEETQGPGIDEARAKEYAAFVRECLKCVPNFRAKLKRIAWGLFDGRSCNEIQWQQRGSPLWQPVNLHWIHPRRLSFGPDRDLRVIDPMQQVGQFRDVGFCVEQVPHKFVTFRPQMFCDYQEREGLAYRCLYWSFFGRLGVREQLELMEIFGKPWRIMTPRTGPGMPAINVEALKEGFQALTLLGFHNAARMPANTDVQVVQPQQGAGQVHAQVITNAKDELSKLILGNVSTTDAVATGLGSGLPGVHQSEQDLILLGDALDVAEAIEDQLTDAIIVANFGPEAMSHCPKFVLRTEQRKDPDTEKKRISGALEVGLRVAEEQARDVLGIREVRADEPYLVRTVRPTALGQVPASPTNETVYPAGKAPQPGELIDVPDAAINVQGDDGGIDDIGEPGLLPDGSPALPLGDGAGLDEDDVAAMCRKMNDLGLERCRHNNPNRCRICGIERIDDVELDAAGAAQWTVEWKPLGGKRLQPLDAAQPGGENDAAQADPALPAPNDGAPDDENAPRIV